MEKLIGYLPGDGIGPEVIDQALKSLKAIEECFNHQFELAAGLVGAVYVQ